MLLVGRKCTHQHYKVASFMRAALTFSWWSPFLFLFPFTAPVVRPLAAKLPDAGFRRILGARKTIRDVALRLIAKHRRFLEQVLSCGTGMYGFEHLGA